MTTRKKPPPRDVEKKTSPRKNVPPTKTPVAKTVDVQQVTTPSTTKFPIVGMGASAGGLDAFETFFKAMPVNSGIAFVLVSHLDPNHSSILAEILQKHTKMKVQQAQDNMKVVPNQVFVIPPNKEMAIINGKKNCNL